METIMVLLAPVAALLALLPAPGQRGRDDR
jgi:hypothetical protein